MPTGAGLTFDVDSIRFDRAMAAFEKLGIEAPKIVKDETRLLLAQVIRFTPPKTLAQGRGAVKRDIGRAIDNVNPDTFHSKRLATMIRTQDVNAMRDAVRRIPSMKDYTVERWNPEAQHEAKRDNRGRIQRNQKVMVLNEGKRLKKYFNLRAKAVGSAKAGYWPGLQAVGGAVPNWVAKHASKFGSVDAGKLNDSHAPRIRIQNFSEAARSQNDENHSVQSAVKMRARSMESKARRMILDAAKSGGLETH